MHLTFLCLLSSEATPHFNCLFVSPQVTSEYSRLVFELDFECRLQGLIIPLKNIFRVNPESNLK